MLTPAPFAKLLRFLDDGAAAEPNALDELAGVALALGVPNDRRCAVPNAGVPVGARGAKRSAAAGAAMPRECDPAPAAAEGAPPAEM